MESITIIQDIVHFISASIEAVFFFIPSLLAMFAFSLLIMLFNRKYEAYNIKRKIVKYSIDIFYLIYCMIRLIPSEIFSEFRSFYIYGFVKFFFI